MTCVILCCLVSCYLILSCLVLSYLVVSCVVLSCRVVSCRVLYLAASTGKQGFNCFEALFGEINSRTSTDHPRGRMQISGSVTLPKPPGILRCIVVSIPTGHLAVYHEVPEDAVLTLRVLECCCFAHAVLRGEGSGGLQARSGAQGDQDQRTKPRTLSP